LGWRPPTLGAACAARAPRNWRRSSSRQFRIALYHIARPGIGNHSQSALK
jgi:hypothetical protein